MERIYCQEHSMHHDEGKPCPLCLMGLGKNIKSILDRTSARLIRDTPELREIKQAVKNVGL